MTIRFVYEIEVAGWPRTDGGTKVCGIAISEKQACEAAKRYALEQGFVTDKAHVVGLKALGEIDFDATARSRTKKEED